MTSAATEAVSRAIIMDSSSQWASSEMTETWEATISRASLSLTKDLTRARTKAQSKSSVSSLDRNAEEAAAWACPSGETVAAAEATVETEVAEMATEAAAEATEETEVAVMATEAVVSEVTGEVAATVADLTMATGTEAATEVTVEASAAEAT